MWNIICAYMGDVYIYIWVETIKLLIISKGITNLIQKIVEPCILKENGIYMIWSHIYICIKNKTAYMHVESCIYNIEVYFITHKDKTLYMYVPCGIMYI